MPFSEDKTESAITPIEHALRNNLCAHLRLSGSTQNTAPPGKLSADTLRDLLARVAGGDSLNAAAARVGVSWRHAWGVVRGAETLLGAPLLISQVGGTGGGGSRLTGAGKTVLEELREISAGIQSVVTEAAVSPGEPADAPANAPANALSCAAPSVLYLAATLESVETGFLDSVVAAFQRDCGGLIGVIPAGSGTALALAQAGRVDLALAHAPNLERRLVQRGALEPGLPIMQSSFVIVGPEGDPAGVREAAVNSDPLEAIRRIARIGAPFISRGDNSGTHMREQALWRAVGIEPVPPWYRTVTGTGNRRVLVQAAEESAYALVDYATTRRWGLGSGQAVLYHDRDVHHDTVMSDYFSFLRARKNHGPTGVEGYTRTTDFLAWFDSKRDELVRTGAVDSQGAPLFEPSR